MCFVLDMCSIFFLSKHSELKLKLPHLLLQLSLVREIGALGFVTLARQAVVSIIYLLVNNILFNLGGSLLWQYML